MTYTKFYKMFLSAFISGNLSLIAPVSAAEENDPLKKMMSGMLSGFVAEMQQELSQREDLKGKEDMTKAFLSGFTNIMGNMMFGDGTNPLAMPILTEIKAQKRFEFIIKKPLGLINYAIHLDEFLTCIHDSSKCIKISALGLINAELNDIIPSHLGFGTDYISPGSPLRRATLAHIRILIDKDLNLADRIISNFMKNKKYDFTKIDHIIQCFEYNLQFFEMTLKSFEKTTSEKREIPSPSQDLSLTSQDLIRANSLIQEIDKQSDSFIRHFHLMNMEWLEQSCRLFLPLFNAMMADKKTRQILQNQDKETFQQINTLLSNYEEYHKILSDYGKHHNALISYQEPNAEEKRGLPRPTPSTHSKKKKKNQSKPTQISAPAPLTTTLSQPQFSERTSQFGRGRGERRAIPRVQSSSSASGSSYEEKDNPLAGWLIGVASCEDQNVSDKKEYQPSSSQERKKKEKKEELDLSEVDEKLKEEDAPRETLETEKEAQFELRETRERAIPRVQSPSSASSSSYGGKDDQFYRLMELVPPQGQNISGKKEYLAPSTQELKEERKKKAKQEKKEKLKSKEENIPQKILEAEKEAENVSSVNFELSGNYDLFESIMEGTYNGEIGAIQLLIKNGFKGVAYLSHGCWHFAIPHISKNHKTVYTSTSDPLEEEEEVMDLLPVSTEATTSQPRSVTTIHNPHKKRNKRLRPYHVNGIKELFERGGYTLDTVKKARELRMAR